jgi:lysophospholipase L1-like esterase
MLLSVWSCSLTLSAAEPAAETAPPFAKLVGDMQLKDGDTVVFLGDSITHQCLYTQYVEDYFLTRYPSTKIRFHNAGVGGDRATDALARFDRDVAEYKPRYVTVLIGMNDGGYGQWTPEMFGTYERDMTALIERIQAIGATPILMTPTMYDTRAALLRAKPPRPVDSPVNKYYNASLAYLGAWVREQAINRGFGFVDMYSPLNNLTIEQRRDNAEFTFIPDAVHPEADGQFIMASSIIEQMHHGPAVSSAMLTRVGDKWNAGRNATASDIQGDANGVTFTLAAKALPWVVPGEASFGYKVTHAGHRLSNESIRIVGLAPGQYDLKIDGQTIGTYAAAQLAFRVELEENAKTPEYQQALAVAVLNKERNDKAMRPLRNLWGALKGKRYANKPEELEKFMPQFDAELAKLKALVEEYDAKISAINKPQPHRYEIVRAAVKAPAPDTEKQSVDKAAATN